MAVAGETSGAQRRRRRHPSGQYSFSAFVDAQQAHAESMFEICRIMVEGLLEAAAELGDALAVMACSSAAWSPVAGGPLGPFAAWPLSQEEQARFDDALARALDVLARTMQRAMAIFVGAPGVFH